MPSTTAKHRIKMHVRKGDTVQVISGKNKGKTGEVLRIQPNENRIVLCAGPGPAKGTMVAVASHLGPVYVSPGSCLLMANFWPTPV